MFTYWPFIGIITSGVMIVVLMVLKFGDKLCKARLTTLSDQSRAPYSGQADDLEMMEDGNGTMMDFNPIQHGGGHICPPKVGIAK